jgi:hypothetical protein
LTNSQFFTYPGSTMNGVTAVIFMSRTSLLVAYARRPRPGVYRIVGDAGSARGIDTG